MKSNLTSIARKLRKKATEAEKQLWQKLRAKQLTGYKFRRQQPIGSCIVDFVNFEKKIIIELDGSQHSVNRDKDIQRDAWFRLEGFQVLRFWNNEVFENMEGVLESIRKQLLSPSPDPSRKGRGNQDPDPINQGREDQDIINK